MSPLTSYNACHCVSKDHLQTFGINGSTAKASSQCAF